MNLYFKRILRVGCLNKSQPHPHLALGKNSCQTMYHLNQATANFHGNKQWSQASYRQLKEGVAMGRLCCKCPLCGSTCIVYILCHMFCLFSETVPPQLRRLTQLQTLVLNDNPLQHAQLRCVSATATQIFSRQPK